MVTTARGDTIGGSYRPHDGHDAPARALSLRSTIDDLAQAARWTFHVAHVSAAVAVRTVRWQKRRGELDVIADDVHPELSAELGRHCRGMTSVSAQLQI